MDQYFLKPYDQSARSLISSIRFILLHNKVRLKKTKLVLTHQIFAKKSDLGSLKSDTGKLDIDRLKTTPIDLSNLSNVVNNEVVKKTIHNDFVKKSYLS